MRKEAKNGKQYFCSKFFKYKDRSKVYLAIVKYFFSQNGHIWAGMLPLRALVSHTFVFVYRREFGYYILFRAVETKNDHCETTQDN